MKKVLEEIEMYLAHMSERKVSEIMRAEGRQSTNKCKQGWHKGRPHSISVVKCLSAHGNDFFDIQMIIVDKTRLHFACGYEIRRKDWAEVTFPFPSISPEYWDARTVYIVRRVHPTYLLV